MSFFTFGNSMYDNFPTLMTMDTDSINSTRQLAFSNKKYVKFFRKTSICTKAICMTDIDNDGNDELCLGTIDGELIIYHIERVINKENLLVNEYGFNNWVSCIATQPLMSIICLVGGNIENSDKSSLIVLSAEGVAYLVNFKHEFIEFVTYNETAEENKELTGGEDDTVSNKLPSCKITPELQFSIPLNVSASIIAPIENKNHLIIGTNDRKVHAFLYKNGGFEQTFCWTLKEQIISLCTSFDFDEMISKKYPIIIAGLPNGFYAKISLHTGLSGIIYKGTNYQTQTLLEDEILESSDFDTDSDDSSQFVPLIGSIVSDSFARKLRHQRAVCSDVIGLKRRANGAGNSLIACANYDGILTFQKNNQVQWEIMLDHPIFSLKAVDVTNNGCDEILACCWDGMVFIVDHNRNIIKFLYPESICAFTSGNIHKNSENPKPCFVFAEFSEKIAIYFDLNVSSLERKSFLSEIDPVLKNSNLSKDWSESERIDFIRSCLTHPFIKNPQEVLDKLKKELQELKENTRQTEKL